ncbi:MAG: serine/threonine-protein kinase [Myxococcales bacterium]
MAQAGPQAILQRYTLLRKIATGGMAEVFLAEQTGAGGFKKRVAIKRILPAFAEDPKFVEMFLDEARVAAMFHHPNLIQIYELGDVDGLLSLVMEYVRGLSLSELLKRAVALGAPPIELGVAARIVAQAAEGLHYAHEFQDPDSGQALELVHRDVSPQNILISKEGIVKVMDFGIAKAAGQMHHTSTGTLKGKLAYMPPEQLNGKPLDRRADVWALGVVLYELLAGRRPFVGDSEAGVFRAILQEEPPELGELRPEVPTLLREIAAGALARDRDRRTATAGELARQLEDYLQGEAHTTPADVSAWLTPLLPAGGESASASGVMLTPSNLQRPPARELVVPTPARSSAPTRVDAAAAGASVTPPSMVTAPTRLKPLPSDHSLLLPPLPQQQRPSWLLWMGGAFLTTFLIGGAGMLVWKVEGGGAPPVEAPVPAPAMAVQPPVPVAVAAPVPAAAPATVPALPRPPPLAAAPTPAPPVAAIPRAAPRPHDKHREPPPRRRGPAAPHEKAVLARSVDPAPADDAPGPMGSLMVNTDPWSNVTVDGRDYGQTPTTPPIRLRAGRHLLVCTNPDSGLVHRETIVIPAGGPPVRRLIKLGGSE